MFCTQCGIKIQQEMKFCPRCGNAKAEAVPPKSENSTETPSCCENNGFCVNEIPKSPIQTNICPAQNQKSSGLSVAGFVCGLVAFCFALTLLAIQIVSDFSAKLSGVPFQAALTIIQTLSILGASFSGSGLAINQGKGKSIAGLVLSILAIFIVLTHWAMSVLLR